MEQILQVIVAFQVLIFIINGLIGAMLYVFILQFNEVFHNGFKSKK